jgi:hypothetical protein
LPLLLPSVYVFVSNRLFHLTNELKDQIVPHDNNRCLARNLIQMLLLGVFVFGIGWILERAIVLHMI